MYLNSRTTWLRPHRAALLLLACTDTSTGTPVLPEGPPDGGVTAAGSMLVGRSNHTATLLKDGRILITGGDTPASGRSTAELLDPSTGHSQAVGFLGTARLSHTATLLGNGKVLIVGGYGSGTASSATAELFDPVTRTFRPSAPPRVPRVDHASVVLNDGRVLILGGDTSGVGRTPTASAEIYEVSTGQFTTTGSMHVPRRPYGVLVLADGRVLVAGGTTTNKQVVSSAEIYDPATGSFTLTGSLAIARHKQASALLPDGRVLVMGGTTGGDDSHVLNSVEFYDPVTGRFTGGAAMLQTRYKSIAVSLDDGSVLVAGGSAADLVEVYDATAGRFRPVAGGSGTLRFFPTATRVSDGSVLVTGGYSAGGSQSTVWRYRRE
jgi:WD40 repeat protein